MIQRHQPAILLFFSHFFAFACQTSDGDGRILGVLSIPSCNIDDNSFHIELEAFAANYFDNTLSLRIQNSASVPTFADGLFLVIRNVKGMASQPPGTAYSIEISPDIPTFKALGPEAGAPQTTPESPARATFYLNETCPGNRLAFTDGGGTLIMDHIYQPGKSRRIKGSFQLEFIDPRYWKSPESPGPFAQIEGDFDFEYNPRKTALTFP